MSIPIITSDIQNLLLPNLMGCGGKYDTTDGQWKAFFPRVKTDFQIVRKAMLRTFGLASVKPQGQAMPTDGLAREEYLAQSQLVSIGLQYEISDEVLEFNQYKDEFINGPKELMNSLGTTKETFLGSYITAGFTATGPDGVPIFSENHPYFEGTYSNTIDAEISEQSLQDMYVLISDLRDLAGKRVNISSKNLVFTPSDRFVVQKIARSDMDPFTPNNASNPVKSIGMFENYYENKFISTPTSRPWFITTNVDGMALFEHGGVKTGSAMTTDGTLNVRAWAQEYYIPMLWDPRCIFGSQGSL